MAVSKAPAITLDNVKADELKAGDNLLKQGTLNFTGCIGVAKAKKGDTGIEVPVTDATASYTLRAGYYLPTTSGVNAGAVETAITVTALYD